MLNLPNLLTLFRTALLPVVVGLIWPGIENRYTCFWAAIVYIVAGAMDVADGILARHYNQVTVFGKFLDPLADKLFHLVTLIALLQLHPARVPPWVVMLFIVRELAITGLRGIAVSEGIVIAAGEGGKTKTLFGTLGMVFLLLHYPYVIHFGFFSALIDLHQVGLWSTYLSVAFSMTSGLGYVSLFIAAVKQKYR